MGTTVKMAPHLVGCPTPLRVLSSNPHGVAVAPVAANNAPHLPRYLRSRMLIEQAQQAAQRAIARRAEEWEENAGLGLQFQLSA